MSIKSRNDIACLLSYKAHLAMKEGRCGDAGIYFGYRNIILDDKLNIIKLKKTLSDVLRYLLEEKPLEIETQVLLNIFTSCFGEEEWQT